MMKIFSLKLAEISNFATRSAGAIQLYGSRAVWDLLDPLRNYIFNRTRDDPFTIHDISNPSIQMTGPKRGITMDARVMIEYDMRIKRGENKQDDLVLVDGAATFSEITNFIQGELRHGGGHKASTLLPCNRGHGATSDICAAQGWLWKPKLDYNLSC
ncbi:hypothetical protein E2562_016098 [Oryza meyeriana var. granulata]|uniref:DUF6598 domain-containing protein n=1 Tax=Oryza meyeriana var. granulata TaxID=110450 RepID=A0A6G1BL34_9ORYZ|nr:hypothetical protein E2562_016098 [Oryza meyeriana var. granulata]